MNGLLYEWLSRAKVVPTQRCFWGSLGMGTLGLILGLTYSEPATWKQILEPKLALMVWVFVGVIGGLLYWMSNTIAFDNLETSAASVLAQGETLAVLIGTHLILGEKMATGQWLGVITAVCGVAYLIYWLDEQRKQPQRV